MSKLFIGVGYGGYERSIPNSDGEPHRMALHAGPAKLDQMVVNLGAVASGMPPLPEKATIFEHLMRVNGIILGGGGDWELYRSDIKPANASAENAVIMRSNRDRDVAEMTILQLARIWNIPLLGICRGAQGMNLERGGTLRNIDHLTSEGTQEKPAGSPLHLVTGDNLFNNSHDAELYGDNPLTKMIALKVGGTTIKGFLSLHHEALDELAPGFEVVAMCPGLDPVYEIWATPNAEHVGTQGHPELQPDHPCMQAISENFMSNAEMYEPLIHRETLDPRALHATQLILAAA